MVDMPWGSDAAGKFVKNVGLVTSTGPHGENIMACEWTYQLSYSPGLIGVSIGTNKATAENIRATNEFGVSLASTAQSTASSIAGGSSGKNADKVAALKKLGYSFGKGKKIKAPFVNGSSLVAECKLVQEIPIGDHVLFVGEVLDVTFSAADSLVYHQWKYFKVGDPIEKPTDEAREHVKKIVEEHAKKKN